MLYPVHTPKDEGRAGLGCLEDIYRALKEQDTEELFVRRNKETHYEMKESSQLSPSVIFISRNIPHTPAPAAAADVVAK